MSQQPIRFFYRGKVHEVADLPPTRTVLQHLREDLRCTGTKEGCAEGDCGACTVVLGELEGEGDTVALKTVNACIQFLPALDGKALFTVEDLRQPDGSLHPVQQAMVDCHGSQCGFCTPGFVMSLWALYVDGRKGVGESGRPDRRLIDDALSGNLCRCTGYRPIIDAAQRMWDLPAVGFDRSALAQALGALKRDGVHDAALAYTAGKQSFYAPASLAQLAALRAALPEAVILAGGTDVALWVTKQMRALDTVIYVGQVPELKIVTEQDGYLEIGAAVSLSDAYAALCRHYPELDTMRQRFASLPIRNAGTLGGNVANGSPIGDSAPWLIALGAQIILRGSEGQRLMPLEAFYLGYQKKDLRPDEFLEAIRVPLPLRNRRFRTYKLAKRFDQDISAVCAAFAITLDDGLVREARIAYGGMAATSQRARHAEAALTGSAWNEVGAQAAMQALAQDFAPLSDMRASAGYRMQAAQRLLYRFWLETRAGDQAALTPQALDVFAAP